MKCLGLYYAKLLDHPATWNVVYKLVIHLSTLKSVNTGRIKCFRKKLYLNAVDEFAGISNVL